MTGISHYSTISCPDLILVFAAFILTSRILLGYIMCSRFTFLTFLVASAFQISAFQNTANIPNGKTRLFFSPPIDGAEGTTELQSAALQNLPQNLLKPDAALNILLENMPTAEKYSLLLQSYASNIIDSTNRTVAALDTMESLFTEMLSKSIAPSEKSSKLLIDASSTFCSSIKLGKSLQLAKAGEIEQTQSAHKCTVGDVTFCNKFLYCVRSFLVVCVPMVAAM